MTKEKSRFETAWHRVSEASCLGRCPNCSMLIYTSHDDGQLFWREPRNNERPVNSEADKNRIIERKYLTDDTLIGPCPHCKIYLHLILVDNELLAQKDLR